VEQGEIPFCPKAAGAVCSKLLPQRMRISFADPGEWTAVPEGSLLQISFEKGDLGKKGQDMFRSEKITADGNEVIHAELPILQGALHFLRLSGETAELGNRQWLSSRITQCLSQQQETLLPGGQRKRFLTGAALTSSSVKVPSSPKTMGLI